MPTSPTRNAIIASLWEWAQQNNDWGKLLVSKIVETGTELTVTDRQEVLKLFWFNNHLGERVDVPPLTCPDCVVHDSNVSLTKICEIRGVNKLAGDQELEFSKNITVVYGENGTGKSGYSRILKIFADCYDTKNNILPNIYSDAPSEEKSVKINYEKSGQSAEFVWTGGNQNDDLRGISAFNNHCVELSLDSGRGLMVKPSGFNLFVLLSSELEKIKQLGQEQANSIGPTPLAWTQSLSSGTASSVFVSGLSYSSDTAKLDNELKFEEEEIKLLEEKQQEAKRLNEDLLNKEISDIGLQVADLNTANNTIARHATLFTSANWDRLVHLLNEELTLQQGENISLSEVLSRYGIDKLTTPEFATFIESADKYLKTLDKEDYPYGEGQSCLYCRQPLNDPVSVQLLSDYKKLLNDNTKEKLRTLRTEIGTLKSQLNTVSTVLLTQATYGIGEDGQVIQPECLSNFNTVIGQIKSAVSSANLTSIQATPFSIDYQDIKKTLEEKIAELTESKGTKSDSLTQLAPELAKLKVAISELEDKKLLAEKSEEIRAHISSFKTKKAMEDKLDSFNTREISQRTTRVRDAVVTTAFINKFQEELARIKPLVVPISFNFRTERGNSVLVQNIASQHKITDILSEGEQKTIALAEFLSEIQIEGHNQPVIFDDPVTSLDHHIVWEVARRLVELSRDRQVIVFTHSLQLLNDIKQISESIPLRGLEYKYYRTEKDASVSGLLSPEPSVAEDKFGRYKGAINALLGASSEERTRRANELAIEGYGKLRASIEVLIEDVVLKETIKRHRHNVALTKFPGINGALIDAKKDVINAVFERCCRYTDAHSNPGNAGQEPSLEELAADFNLIVGISDEFSRAQ